MTDSLFFRLTLAIPDNELSDHLNELRTAQKSKQWKDITEEEKINEIQNLLENQSMQMKFFNRKMENSTRLLLEAQNQNLLSPRASTLISNFDLDSK